MDVYVCYIGLARARCSRQPLKERFLIIIYSASASILLVLSIHSKKSTTYTLLARASCSSYQSIPKKYNIYSAGASILLVLSIHSKKSTTYTSLARASCSSYQSIPKKYNIYSASASILLVLSIIPKIATLKIHASIKNKNFFRIRIPSKNPLNLRHNNTTTMNVAVMQSPLKTNYK